MFVSERQGNLFIVSGPSGVGKTTVVTKFLHDYGEQCNIERAVTYTTKKPRDIEANGQDYHFITQEEFKMWGMHTQMQQMSHIGLYLV